MNSINTIAAIKNYILYLKSYHGLSITLHPIKDNGLIIESDLRCFNIHDNPYCIFVKTINDAFHHCIARQQKVLDKVKFGSFCGICYCGIKEYVYPIINKGEAIGFICISGYKCENYSDYIKGTAKKYNLSSHSLSQAYSYLKNKIPDKKFIDTLITPLCQMLELAYSKCADVDDPKPDLYQNILHYLREHHRENITTADICNHFFSSRSYISHLFKKHSGIGIHEYINMLRMEDAKALLSYSDLSVTRIAAAIGFGNCNYFSDLFKRTNGLSPREYRKNSNL